MSGLPNPPHATVRELRRFDRQHGIPAALGVLRAQLTVAELAGVALAMAAGGLRDPLRALPKSPRWSPLVEDLVRHQLRAAVRLDDATRRALRGPAWPETRRQALLLEVIAVTGSRFIEHTMPFPCLDAWRDAAPSARARFMEALRGRAFNAQLEPAGVSAVAMGFDVSACRFVELCHELERPYLAPMFCESDSRFFAERSDLIELKRTRTQARDAAPCDFRFTLRS